MAEVTLFHFRDRDTLLNRLHPLTKVTIMLALSTALAQSEMPRALFLLSFLVVCALLIRLPFGNYRRELRFFLIMGTVMALARSLHAEHWTEVFAVVSRFAAIVLMGLIFADTTAPDDLARAIGGAMEPIFHGRGYRMGATLELTLSTVPFLFDVAFQVSQARKARGESAWHHPIRRIVSYGTTVFDLLLQRAQELESALRARNFSPDRKRSSIRFGRIDLLTVVITLATVVVLIIFI